MSNRLLFVVTMLAATATAVPHDLIRRGIFHYVCDLFSSRLVGASRFPASAYWRCKQRHYKEHREQQKPEWCKPLPRPEYKSLERILPDDPWFEVYKVAPGVFAIYEPHQAEEVISYLIVGIKQAVLFDTGMGISDIRRVTTKLTSRPVWFSIRTPTTTTSAATGSSPLFMAWTPISRGRMPKARVKTRRRKLPRSALRRLAEGIQSKNICHGTLENLALHPRRLQSQSRRPHARSSIHARPYAGCHLSPRPRQRPALYR